MLKFNIFYENFKKYISKILKIYLKKCFQNPLFKNFYEILKLKNKQILIRWWKKNNLKFYLRNFQNIISKFQISKILKNIIWYILILTKIF